MKATFGHLVFNMNPESSKAFTASVFKDKPKSAIWMDPEVTSSTVRGFHANDLNMILEGSLNKSVSQKNKEQTVSVVDVYLRYKNQVMHIMTCLHRWLTGRDM